MRGLGDMKRCPTAAIAIGSHAPLGSWDTSKGAENFWVDESDIGCCRTLFLFLHSPLFFSLPITSSIGATAYLRRRYRLVPLA